MEHLADRPFRLKLAAQETTDFDLHPELRPKNPTLRDAAVLVPLRRINADWHVVLTKRSAALAHHPGQIAFPGGKVDATDGSSISAALREANEEIGLLPSSVDVIGELPCHETVTGFYVRPYVGVIRDAFDPVPEAGEVDEVFDVPLAHVTDAQNFLVQSRVWMGVERRFYTVPYGPYYIWGATARMLRMLCDSIEDIYAD